MYDTSSQPGVRYNMDQYRGNCPRKAKYAWGRGRVFPRLIQVSAVVRETGIFPTHRRTSRGQRSRYGPRSDPCIAPTHSCGHGQQGSCPPRSSYYRKFHGRRRRRRKRTPCHGHRRPSPVSLADRHARTASWPPRYPRALSSSKILIRVSRSRFGLRAFAAGISSSSAFQGPIFGCGWMLRSQVSSVTPVRITFRTVFRDTRSSWQIFLIDFLSRKCARRIFAIVSTTNIPIHAPCQTREHHQHKCRGGAFWTPITPLRGQFCTPVHTSGTLTRTYQLRSSPGIRPVAVYEELLRQHPDWGTGIRRTLERRITHGMPRTAPNRK